MQLLAGRRDAVGRLPVRWRLALFYAALSAAILLVFGLLLYRELERYLLESAAGRLRAQIAPVLERNVAEPHAFLSPGPGSAPPEDTVVIRPLPDIDAQLAGIARELTTGDTAALVLTPEGLLRVRPARFPEQPEPPAPDPERLRQVLDGASAVSYITPGRRDGERMMVLLTPVRFPPDGSLAGVLEVATPLAPADALLARLRTLLVVGLGGALGLSLLLGLPLTRAALRPLDRLVATAERISSGDLAARSRLPHGRDEIGRLAAAFDHMLGRVETSFRTQRQFVADAAHELRTPLTAISGLVELLLLGADNEDRQVRRRTLTTVDKDLRRLARLVNDLLTLSRHDLSVATERRPLDLAALVADIHAETAALAPGREVALDGASGSVAVLGDPDQLRQVLLNLADNARRYTPAGGRIAFRLRCESGVACLEVADTGPGIMPEDLPRIFERFYRGDQARARGSGGAGLGLAIARAIAEAHGGTLTAESRVGAGATFTLRLPRAGVSGLQVLGAPDTASSPALR